MSGDPLTALAQGITRGTATYGPYLTDEDGNPVLPDVKNGYWYFLDRHPEHADAHSDAEVLQRSSINCTLALFDTDSDILCYAELDT